MRNHSTDEKCTHTPTQTHTQVMIQSLLTSRRSRLMKLVIANPSMMSSSCELDSRLFLRGGRGALAAAAGRGAFLPGREAASLPGLSPPSRSEQEELGLSLLPASRNLRTLSRLALRPPCFNFPSMLSKRNVNITPQRGARLAAPCNNNTRTHSRAHTHTHKHTH